MVKVSKCCCCVPVKPGAYCIGYFHLLLLALGLMFMEPLTISSEAFCGATFILMVWKDSAQKRLFYFSAYLVYALLIGVIRIVFTFWNKDEQQMTAAICNTLNERAPLPGQTDQWAGTGYDNLADCQ